jgi:hypothetical protein
MGADLPEHYQPEPDRRRVLLTGPRAGVSTGRSGHGSDALHGIILTVAALPGITALACTCFVFARRFASEPRWHGWAIYSVITGLLTIGFITAFGAVGAHGGLAGLYERLAVGVHSLWSFVLLVRLPSLRPLPTG